MNKEYLEAKAEDISKLLYEVYDVPSGICEQIKNMVHRLESIDNANPSEALECLEFICKILNEKRIDVKWLFKNDYNTIKQALLKAQDNARSEEILQKYYQEGITLDSVRALKQERDNYKKALEIIKKKNVNMFGFKRDIKQLGNRFTYKYYQSNLGNYHSGFEIQELTEEEYEIIKEVLEC